MPDFTDRWSHLAAPGLQEILPVKPRELKNLPLFKNVDYEQLQLASEDLARGIWQDGAALFNEGDYIDLAFMIISGNVKLLSHVQAQTPHLNAAVFSAHNLWQTEESSGVMKSRLGKGDMFGEIGVVCGWPQPFAAVTEGACELLHIRMPAMRRLRSKIKSLDELLGKEYARQVVLGVLKQHPLFAEINETALTEVAAACELCNYEPGQTIVEEHTVADTLYLMRAGFARISRVLVEESVTLNYLEPGEVFGAGEFLQMRGRIYTHTLTSYKYADVLKIPYAALRDLLHANLHMPTRLHDCARAFNAKTTFEQAPVTPSFPTLFLEAPKPETKTLPDPERLARLENIVAQGLMQGENTMLIDLARCTQCDDCVRACADTHEDLSRFVREGQRVDNWLVANSCRHCHDPLCLIGCPTGAIARRGANAIVEIDENLCIGCKACAVHCPYDAIIMHDTGEIWEGINAPQTNMVGKAKLVASKCDACSNTSHGPACVKACPVGCLVRVGEVKAFLEKADR